MCFLWFVAIIYYPWFRSIDTFYDEFLCMISTITTSTDGCLLFCGNWTEFSYENRTGNALDNLLASFDIKLHVSTVEICHTYWSLIILLWLEIFPGQWWPRCFMCVQLPLDGFLSIRCQKKQMNMVEFEQALISQMHLRKIMNSLFISYVEVISVW